MQCVHSGQSCPNPRHAKTIKATGPPVHTSGNPTQIRMARKHTHIWLPQLHCGHGQAEKYRACSPSTSTQNAFFFWPIGTPETICVQLDYNQPTKQNYPTQNLHQSHFFKIGRNSYFVTHRNKHRKLNKIETEDYAPIEGTQNHRGKKIY